MSFSWYVFEFRVPSLGDLAKLVERCDPNARVLVAEKPRGDVGGAPFVLRNPEGDDDLASFYRGSRLRGSS